MSDMKTTTPYNSPDLHFDCPSNVSSFEVWKEATPMLGRKGFQATGAGCTAKSKFNGTHASFGGGVGPDGATWGCSGTFLLGYHPLDPPTSLTLGPSSADDGKTFVWQSVSGLREWTYVQLCEWKNMVLEEHNLVISNTPAGSASIFISDFSDYLEDKTDGKTTVVAQWGTTSRPTPTAVAVDTSSNSTGTTVSNSFSTSVETNVSSAAAGSASTGTLLLFIGVGLVLIVVICLALCLCLRTKPKQDDADQAERSVGRQRRRKTRRQNSGASASSEDGDSLLGEDKRDRRDTGLRREDSRQAGYVD
ncbi:hypothetical protein RTBOTA2_006161 [Rhodotorula toruloides]|uniref:Uncharacterized protein n=1 Tax=Rhodotorula toruloides TaxID=5286 RepID=A0A0K3CQ00_RHOTO|nr:hypothetical protein RTBOTA2_006161 [Rhodotorula toruloides]